MCKASDCATAWCRCSPDVPEAAHDSCYALIDAAFSAKAGA
ncbi:hypothetical protein [Streptomyces sp. NPDC006134]